MASRLTVVLIIAVALIASIGFLVRNGTLDRHIDALIGTEQTSYGCTKEARVCSDGTVVTRTGPSCVFAECPNDRITDLTPSSTVPDVPSPPVGEATPSGPPNEKIVACTMDAKQCPDGSYVGRSGPNCEFVCPSEPIGGTVIVYGVVTIGPSCPVMRMPPDDSCADTPYQGTIMLTNTSSGQSYVAQTNDRGEFTLTIMRGVYDVSRPPGSSPFPACGGKIEITAPGGPIPISCDSGIR